MENEELRILRLQIETQKKRILDHLCCDDTETIIVGHELDILILLSRQSQAVEDKDRVSSVIDGVFNG